MRSSWSQSSLRETEHHHAVAVNKRLPEPRPGDPFPVPAFRDLADVKHLSHLISRGGMRLWLLSFKFPKLKPHAPFAGHGEQHPPLRLLAARKAERGGGVAQEQNAIQPVRNRVMQMPAPVSP